MKKSKPKILTGLGATIKKHRLKLGLSQEKLAEICELDRTYISLVERGNRNLSFISLSKLAIGLKTTISLLTKGL
ncbi:MAG: helix-turn-helix transcriptional regulator [Nitrospina sp.]|jgi:transcriptional regulator with XRE-family HTH domain|nr:helix-turn-helix transcriptional regulator [Nitrospina sp.]MBT4105256.1 helix-turn-helix transcriptional regulator [Nitrospina sp.]MBT4388826.1 helix-turn-helix transcriptional regulator [Nitrospina sp.]MBT4622003.1 helix-turn-helix transcriptional regulator [Nitrospina sp.]MBT4898060.1 helix-turn-helix transcriptional regulator [Nitrospina sp.]